MPWPTCALHPPQCHLTVQCPLSSLPGNLSKGSGQRAVHAVIGTRHLLRLLCPGQRVHFIPPSVISLCSARCHLYQAICLRALANVPCTLSSVPGIFCVFYALANVCTSSPPVSSHCAVPVVISTRQFV